MSCDALVTIGPWLVFAWIIGSRVRQRVVVFERIRTLSTLVEHGRRPGLAQ